MTPNIRHAVIVLLTSGAAFAQTSLILKTHRIETDPAQLVMEARGSNASGSGYLLLQFDRTPSAAHIRQLVSRGVTVLADVPENGVLVSVTGPVNLDGLGVRYAAPVAEADKISALAAGNKNGHLLVEFYPDVNLDDARGMLLNTGAALSEHPDLGAHVLMIRTADMALVNKVAELDAVSYIFPASNDLARGLAARPCAGALTTNGATTQSVPTYGYGWDGPGLGSATVLYYYSNVTAQLNAVAAKAEIARAMAQWSNVVKVTWAPGYSATANQTVNILWATYAHGDAYPFAGPGGMLAHTFYPANPNPEPIAGDMHLNDSEAWGIGVNIDLYSVTLHELGHALGLGHSDNPTDVMYPYYKMETTLQAGDIAAIQTMYASQGAAVTPSASTPSTPASNITLLVNPTSANTTAATLNLTGSATGSGTVVTWTMASSSVGISGTAAGTAGAWTISSIPLAMGVNTVTVTATGGSGKVSQTVTVTRQAAAISIPPSTSGGGTDTTPPALTITTPGATSVSTSASTITVSGTSSDNVGVTSVTWSTNMGQSGTASGTTNWLASIPLLVGSNVVTVRAYDAAGNTGWRSVVVSRN